MFESVGTDCHLAGQSVTGRTVRLERSTRNMPSTQGDGNWIEAADHPFEPYVK